MNIDELQAGPVLDALVAERVMEWTKIKSMCGLVRSDSSWLDKRTGCRKAQKHWSPSTDIAAAWEVWEALPREYKPLSNIGITWGITDSHYMFHPNGERVYICQGILDCGEIKWHAEAETAPLAICRMALKYKTEAHP